MTPAARTPARRSRPGVVAALVAAVAGVALMGGCDTAAPLPPQPATVEVTMRDHAYDLQPEPPIPAGRVVFRARNAGEARHELAIVDIADDPGQQRGPQPVVTVGVIHPRPPGETGSVAVDLAAGRYALVCLVRDQDGVTHAEHGQRVDFEVR